MNVFSDWLTLFGFRQNRCTGRSVESYIKTRRGRVTFRKQFMHPLPPSPGIKIRQNVAASRPAATMFQLHVSDNQTAFVSTRTYRPCSGSFSHGFRSLASVSQKSCSQFSPNSQDGDAIDILLAISGDRPVLCRDQCGHAISRSGRSNLSWPRDFAAERRREAGQNLVDKPATGK